VSANELLDRLPRTRVGRLGREAPAFRVCGEAGFHAALVALLAAGLVRGLSLAALAVVALVCAASFFAWAMARRAVAGREALVLLEHVWLALACSALVLWALGEPVLASLDAVAVALPVFLAGGRVGCLLAGCCHGRPSSVGIVYPGGALAGVRVFPVALLEAAALVVIAAGGFAALPFAPAGAVLTWYLAAYGVVRFGLEGLRGDRRPELLGLSVNRWMCVGELAAAVAVADEEPVLAAVVVGTAVLGAVALMPRRRRERPEALGALVETLAGGQGAPALGRTPRGVAVGVSTEPDGSRHVSLSVPGRHDVAYLCELAARGLDGVEPESVVLGDTALHVRARPGGGSEVSGQDLYRRVALREQQGRASIGATRRAYFGVE
jgi:hypothetical protein